MPHPLALIVLVCAGAATIAWLSDARSARELGKAFLISVVFFVVLMGLGAVFGKTLGDFLRGR